MRKKIVFFMDVIFKVTLDPFAFWFVAALAMIAYLGGVLYNEARRTADGLPVSMPRLVIRLLPLVPMAITTVTGTLHGVGGYSDGHKWLTSATNVIAILAIPGFLLMYGIFLVAAFAIIPLVGHLGGSKQRPAMLTVPGLVTTAVVTALIGTHWLALPAFATVALGLLLTATGYAGRAPSAPPSSGG